MQEAAATSGNNQDKVSPMAMSTGILTKRADFIEPDPAPFELKLNVTDTEFVVVEDTSSWDTNAVILKVSVLRVAAYLRSVF